MKKDKITISFEVDIEEAENVMQYVKTLPKSEQTTKPTSFARKIFLKFAEGFGALKPSEIEIENGFIP